MHDLTSWRDGVGVQPGSFLVERACETQDAFGDKYTLVLSRMDEVNTAIILPTYAVVDNNLSSSNEVTAAATLFRNLLPCGWLLMDTLKCHL